MPKIADIEYTPNPNAVKFILKEPVTIGSSRSFQSAEAALADPLADSLFKVGNVTSVFYMDGGAEHLPAFARDVAALERRELAGDGGGLEIIGFHDKKLMISYQGACGSCPSSIGGTLMAIEHMLKEDVDPEIEVISV